jgi:hypothetical protein
MNDHTLNYLVSFVPLLISTDLDLILFPLSHYLTSTDSPVIILLFSMFPFPFSCPYLFLLLDSLFVL